MSNSKKSLVLACCITFKLIATHCSSVIMCSQAAYYLNSQCHSQKESALFLQIHSDKSKNCYTILGLLRFLLKWRFLPRITPQSELFYLTDLSKLLKADIHTP